MFKKIGLFIVAAFLLAGCHSDILYQNQAVERARKHLLENDRNLNLTAQEINFIRFNAPLLLHAPVLGSNVLSGEKAHLQSELRQICVTWMIPGRKELYMVYGVSDARMSGWSPERILVKEFKKHTPVLTGAVVLARKYAQKNIYQQLSVADANTVRFSFPYLMRTDLELNFDQEGKLSREELAAAQKDAAGKIQYSLVWKLENGNALVFAGLADKGFVNWNFNVVELMSADALENIVSAVVMTPEQGLDALPEEELSGDK